MQESSYSVDHHIIQIVYFEGNNELPTGKEFAQVWTGLGRLGKHRISGSFWHLCSPSPSAKIRRIPLGSPEVFTQLLTNSDNPIGGGGISKQKNITRPTMDCDFYLAMSDSSRCKFGWCLPYFQLAISNQWVEHAGAQTVVDIMRNNLTIFDIQAPSYGFIDISRPEESTAGHAYTPIRLMPLPLNRWVEQALWVHSTNEQRDEVRSIFWGNYFGPRILDRLGGKSNFLARFRECTTLNDGTPTAFTWEFNHGVFVSLSTDPLDCVPGKWFGINVMLNFERLARDLIAHRVLMGSANVP